MYNQHYLTFIWGFLNFRRKIVPVVCGTPSKMSNARRILSQLLFLFFWETLVVSIINYTRIRPPWYRSTSSIETVYNNVEDKDYLTHSSWRRRDLFISIISIFFSNSLSLSLSVYPLFILLFLALCQFIKILVTSMQILGMTAHSRMIGSNYLRSDGQSHGTSRLTTKWKIKRYRVTWCQWFYRNI